MTLILAAIFGLIVGSFLNVCIHRLPREESLAWPASRCPRCGVPLKWYDNVPLVGYLMLKGRCRECRNPISARYPVVELLTMAVFVAASLLYEFLFIRRGPEPVDHGELRP